MKKFARKIFKAFITWIITHPKKTLAFVSMIVTATIGNWKPELVEPLTNLLSGLLDIFATAPVDVIEPVEVVVVE